MQRWAKILGRKGWLGYGWPKEFGGPGWSAVQKHLFEEECALAPRNPSSPEMLFLSLPLARAVRPSQRAKRCAARSRPPRARERAQRRDHEPAIRRTTQQESGAVGVASQWGESEATGPHEDSEPRGSAAAEGVRNRHRRTGYNHAKAIAITARAGGKRIDLGLLRRRVTRVRTTDSHSLASVPIPTNALNQPSAQGPLPPHCGSLTRARSPSPPLTERRGAARAVAVEGELRAQRAAAPRAGRCRALRRHPRALRRANRGAHPRRRHRRSRRPRAPGTTRIRCGPSCC